MLPFGNTVKCLALVYTAIFVQHLEKQTTTYENLVRNDDAGSISRELRRAGGKLRLGCGRFLIAKTILLPSNSELAGSGDCTVLKLAPGIEPNVNWHHVPATYPNGYPGNILSNEDYEKGNIAIRVHDLVIDGTAGTDGKRRVHLAAFYKVSDVNIERVRFLGSRTPDVQDGVAFVASSRYLVQHSEGFGLWNACFDQWDGSHDFVVSKNICDGESSSNYGVLVNGISTAHTYNLTYNGIIAANVIRRINNVAVFVGGLWNNSRSTPVYGRVDNVRVSENRVEKVLRFHGILISDATNILVADNYVSGIAREGIRVGSQFRGNTSNITVRKNSITRTNEAQAHDGDAIRITNGARNVTVSQNSVDGTSHRCAIGIDPGVSDARFVSGSNVLSPGYEGALCDRRSVARPPLGEHGFGAPE